MNETSGRLTEQRIEGSVGLAQPRQAMHVVVTRPASVLQMEVLS